MNAIKVRELRVEAWQIKQEVLQVKDLEKDFLAASKIPEKQKKQGLSELRAKCLIIVSNNGLNECYKKLVAAKQIQDFLSLGTTDVAEEQKTE